MKNILVPIDFSAISKSIINEAIIYAKSANTKIYLIHIVQLKFEEITDKKRDITFSELKGIELKKELQDMRYFKNYIIESGVDCEANVLQGGAPADIILNEIQNIDADLLVIGSLGHGDLYEVFIGSVASEVIEKISIPLLLVPKMD